MKWIQDYWPLLALALWLTYKWWNARRITALLPQLKSQGAVLLDVRTEAEFASDHAPGTRNIPLHHLSQHLSSIPKNSPVVVGCASGSRSGMAMLILKKNGYRQVFNIGSWRNFMT